MIRLTPVVRNLLILNVGIFLLQQISAYVTGYLALWPLDSPFFKPYQFFSYMFAHSDFFHLLFNMILVLALGRMLEEFLGQQKMLVFVMVTGIGAGMLYSGINYYKNIQYRNTVAAYSANPDPGKFSKIISDNFGGSGRAEHAEFIDEFGRNPENKGLIEQSKRLLASLIGSIAHRSPMIGASGMAYGILLACGIYFPNTQLYLIFPPIPIKVIHMTLILGIFAIYNSYTDSGKDNVAHLAHLGGMVFAFLLIKIWQKTTG